MGLTEDKAAEKILLNAYNDCNKNNTVQYFTSLPPSYKSIVHTVAFPGLLLKICIIAFFLGIASNYLSPTGKVHVLYNPILLLVLWNFFVYSVLIYGALKNLFSPPKIKINSTGVPPIQKTLGDHEKSGFIDYVKTGLIRSIFYKILIKFQKHTDANIYTLFWKNWYKVANSLVNKRLLRLLNSGSIALTSGAIVGIYLRGLVVEYNVVWTSTFVRDEASISTLINIILGSAIKVYSLLIGHNIITDLNIDGLTSPNGVLASPWIHLFVITALTFIIFPRVVLATWETINIRKLKNNIDLPDDMPEEDVEDKRVFKINNTVRELSDYFILMPEEQRLLFSLEYYLACADKESEHDSQLSKKKERWIRDWYNSINVAIVTDKTKLFKGLEEIKEQKMSLPKLGTILLETNIFRPYFPITQHKRKKDDLKYNTENHKKEINNICDKIDFSEHLVEEAKECFEEALKEIPPSNFWKKAMIVLISAILLMVTGGVAAPIIGGAIGGAMGLAGVAAVNAGLALLGGGAIAAGGLGMAGGTAVIIGGGAILGGGAASAGLMFLFSSSKHLVLRELAKMEAVSKVFLKTLPDADDAINTVITKEQEMKNCMEVEISKLKLKGDSSKEKIKELEAGIEYYEKAINRLKDFIELNTKSVYNRPFG